MRKYLRFECGAALPRNRDMTEKCERDFPKVCPQRKRDGAYRLLVYDSENSTDSYRPSFPDGRTARCLVDCPANKTKAGRRQQSCFPSNEALVGRKWRVVVTCHGKMTVEK